MADWWIEERREPAAATLTITGHPPKIIQENDNNLSPERALIEVIGHRPRLKSILRPGGAELTVTGHAPKVFVSNNTVIKPARAELEIVGHAPSVRLTENSLIYPPAAVVEVVGHAPALHGPSFDQLGASNVLSTNESSPTTNFSAAAGADVFFIALAQFDGIAQAGITATYDGNSMDLIEEQTLSVDATDGRLAIFVAQGAGTGSAEPLQVFTGGGYSLIARPFSMFNVHDIEVLDTDSGFSATAAIDLTADSDEMTLAILGNQGFQVLGTPTGGINLFRSQTHFNGQTIAVNYTLGSESYSGTITSTDPWAAIGLKLR